MFENIKNFFKNISKKEEKSKTQESSKDTAKERLHLVLMQDRANVSADFLELMKQEIIEVIKKYIEIDEKEIDVRLTNKENEDGTNGAPALYANIPILNIKNDARKINKNSNFEDNKTEGEEQESEKEDKIEEEEDKTEKNNDEQVKKEIEKESENSVQKNTESTDSRDEKVLEEIKSEE